MGSNTLSFSETSDRHTHEEEGWNGVNESIHGTTGAINQQQALQQSMLKCYFIPTEYSQ